MANITSTKDELEKKEKTSKTQSKAELKRLIEAAVQRAREDGYSAENINTDLNDALLGLSIQAKPNTLMRIRLMKGMSRVAVVVLFIAVVLSSSFDLAAEDIYDFLKTHDCFVTTNLLVTEAGRPISDCNMCRGLREVPVSTDMSKEIFLRHYAYSGKPVLIKQATANWSAIKEFDFYFFRDLYAKYPNSAEIVENHCNFLRYQTEFMTLEDFLKMDDDQVRRLDWYVGWSNCDKRVMKELRNYYQRPFFLPEDSVSSSLDWIFIGGAGPGAGLHIDVVDAPSWQAQIRGEKTWTMVPPYECEHECQNLNVTVEQGDIIVLDTNLWFHKTEISEGEMSITIGSEYD